MRDNCAAPVSTIDGVVTIETSACANGETVELITVSDAGHQWPGSIGKYTGSSITRRNHPSTAFDATSVIWDFFAAA
jgi:polyhydroxybutyrate depolymerase